MSYIFWKFLFQRIIWAIKKHFLSILRGVRFLLTQWDVYINSILHCVIHSFWSNAIFSYKELYIWMAAFPLQLPHSSPMTPRLLHLGADRPRSISRPLFIQRHRALLSPSQLWISTSIDLGKVPRNYIFHRPWKQKQKNPKVNHYFGGFWNFMNPFEYGKSLPSKKNWNPNPTQP